LDEFCGREQETIVLSMLTRHGRATPLQHVAPTAEHGSGLLDHRRRQRPAQGQLVDA